MRQETWAIPLSFTRDTKMGDCRWQRVPDLGVRISEAEALQALERR